ncbi:MAG: SurA N-terminal domain-containing protein [Bacteroidia bacterium]
MSTLETLRKRSGLLVAIVGVALLAFVLTGVFESGSTLFGGSVNSVGEIGGKKIDYAEFKNKVDKAIENQKVNNNKASLDQTETDAIVQQVWNQEINEQVLNKEYEKLGISISDEELYDLMVDHPHPALVRYISDPQTGKVAPVFADDKTGQISPAKIRQFTQAMTPEQEKQWSQLETYIRQVRIVEKYNNLIKNGLYVTTAAAKSNYIADNTNNNIKYIIKEYSVIVDSTVKPTEAELNEYYNAHQQRYKQEASRKIEYVAFNITPSSEDIIETEKEMKNIASEFKTKTVAEDSAFVVAESFNRNVDMTYHTKGTLSPIIDSTMFSAEIGTVVGPYLENGTYIISKLIGSKTAADSARVRHILIAYKDSGASPDIKRTKEAAKTMADSLLTLLKKGAKFTDFVENFSDDNGKKMPPNKSPNESFPGKGGDYGWLNANSSFVEPFKNAGLDGKKGELSVVESQFGYHIIEVMDTKGSEKKVRVVSIDKKLQPSNKTLQGIFVKASEFAGKNTSEDLFEKAVVDEKLNKRVAENVKENDRTLAGVESPRPLIKWAYENKKGVVSEPLEFGDKYIVAVVTEIREKGIAKLEEVKEQVTAKVIKAKKASQLSKELNDAIAGSPTTIDALSTKLNLPVQQAQNINFNSVALPGTSGEPSIVGAVTALKPQTLSKPLVGEKGVFLTYIESRTEAPALKDFKAQQASALSQLKPRVDYEVYEALKQNANVEEHLIKFGY